MKKIKLINKIININMQKIYSGNFIDDNNVKFIEGPWFFKGVKYDYKLIEGESTKDNTDFCSINQMIDWKVKQVTFF